MIVICDSREKWTQSDRKDCHIKEYFDRHGIEYVIRKLDVGDYQLEGQPNLSVDRKHDLEELSRNLMNRSDSSRFWREVRRAHDQGVKLVVLIESGRSCQNINQVVKWKSKYSPVTGRRLIDEMIRLEFSYGVVWKFCDKRSTGKRIVDILTGKEKV